LDGRSKIWGEVREERARTNGEQRDEEQGEDDGMGSSVELGLGGVSAVLGVVKGGNNCLIIYSPKTSLFFSEGWE
jgi:hypothetical protein